MAVSLKKGQNVFLDQGLNRILVGLGWDERLTTGEDFDLDASAFMLGAHGKVPNDRGFIFYNQLKSPCGAVVHQGDNLTGGSEGDDEIIEMDLTKMPADIHKIVITVTIYEAEKRKQNFGMVSNAYIRVVDAESQREILRYDLSEDYSIETALIFGEVYRHNDQWKFRAVGQGFAGGLLSLALNYGVNVG